MNLDQILAGPHWAGAVGCRRDRASRRGRALGTLLLTALVCCLLPQWAAAEATPGSEPTAGPSGLPDGRVYEQASPPNKYASEAGGSFDVDPFIAAGVGGDEVAFFNPGPLGETPAGVDYFSIAHRTATGWHTHAAVPRGEGVQGTFVTNPENGLGFSADMTATLFGAKDTFVPEQETSSPTPHIYRYSEDGTVQWLGKPAIAKPLAFLNFPEDGQLAGASPDYDTVYYAFNGVLTPEEEEKDPHLGDISRRGAVESLNGGAGAATADYGFFEWQDGSLRYAGVLPDGYVDPYGAASAATADDRYYSAEHLDNQVSEDGSKAFFVSPDPDANSGRPTELYVRETATDGAKRSILVSRDPLLPQVEGEAAPAPDGVLDGGGSSEYGSYMHASPDGKRVFFESVDQLTSEAPVDERAKQYMFDTETETLTYLPGVAELEIPCKPCSALPSHVLAVSQNGSDFLFLRAHALGVWRDGKVTEVAADATRPYESLNVVRVTPSGSTFVFQGHSPLSTFKFNNGAGAYEEVYRYEVASNKLECVSCPPAGTAPTGDASLSHDFPRGNLGNTFLDITGNRGISEDGSRIFFDSPDTLVPQDTNGKRDAYEWENGTRYLISTGVSDEESFFGDNSPSGNDVFFSTSEGLVTGDTDNGFDVYDARVPRPGDQLPPSAAPCEGAVCQGPPSVPNLLGAPASETLSGPGNQTAGRPHRRRNRATVRRRRLRRVGRRCRLRYRHRADKQRRCVRRARPSTSRDHVKGKHNGRGK